MRRALLRRFTLAAVRLAVLRRVNAAITADKLDPDPVLVGASVLSAFLLAALAVWALLWVFFGRPRGGAARASEFGLMALRDHIASRR